MCASVATVSGAIVLIAVVLPWFLIAVFFVVVLYGYAAAYYRASARELKVNESPLRYLGISFLCSGSTLCSDLPCTRISPSRCLDFPLLELMGRRTDS